jgi:hypothetical protein
MSSPFKFLDAFERGDKAIFFGRAEEIEQLYRLVFEAKLVLVYGASGTGKTSLIQCGLANRFAETDWFQIFVRRTDDINASLDREVQSRAQTPIPEGTRPVEAIRSLYLDHLRPIYLIFDQFEELFILGSKEEQDRFFATAAAIIASDVSCKIIISLREEYLASLHRFEELVPTLFNKRLRVEPMSMTNVEQVITGTTAALGIALEHGEDTAELIIAQLDDNRVGIQLAYLQVYLDSLYGRAVVNGPPIVFTDAAVMETGKLGDIMAGFLDEQTAAIQAGLAARHSAMPKNGVGHLLEEFVTVDGTKQPTSREELLARLPDIAPWIDDALAALQAARILRNVDGRFELAHDSLAARICESRSGDRRAMLSVQKIVRDRIAAFPQTKSRLNAEELAIVNRSRRQVDSVRGTPLLELTPAELRFVKQSASKLRWRRYRFIAGIMAVTTVILLSLGAVVLQALDFDDAAVAATNETDWLAYRSYSLLKNRTDPEIVALRSDLIRAQAELNTNREFGLGTIEENEDMFWARLGDADLAAEAGRTEEARKAHFQLERELRAALDEDPLSLRARVRLKAVQWRLYSSEGDERAALQRVKSILALTTPADGYPPVDFTNDVRDACFEMFVMQQKDERCAGQEFPPLTEEQPETTSAE